MEITKHDKRTLWLREQLASGETEEGDKFTVALNINGGSLIFLFPEATYTIMLNTIVDEVMEFRKSNAVETGKEGCYNGEPVVDE